MKKIHLLVLSLLLPLFLVACQSSKSTESSSGETLTATVTIEFSDEKTDTETVSFKEGDSVMDLLKQNHEIESASGMITAIDGVSQDEATSTYWMYDVNDELAPKGAEEQIVKDGDKIKFYLQTYQ